MRTSVKFGHQQRNTTTDPKEIHMKTEFFRSNKDNVATSTLVAIMLFATASGVFNSSPAEANRSADAIQKMDTIVVTASRSADIRLDTIVVTASRKIVRG